MHDGYSRYLIITNRIIKISSINLYIILDFTEALKICPPPNHEKQKITNKTKSKTKNSQITGTLWTDKLGETKKTAEEETESFIKE